MLAYTLSSQQKNEVPFEKICNVGPYEENEQCGDGDVTEKGNEIVLDNFKKKPYEVGNEFVLDNFKKWETNQLCNQRLFFFFSPATQPWRWKSGRGERDRETKRRAVEEFFYLRNIFCVFLIF